jgi:DNA-binding MarR family transcriptional regulator
MNEKAVETIQFELATLVRYISSVSSDKNGKLDRSGFLLLHRLSSHGATGVKTLAHEFHLDISTVSRQAAALEQKGFVYKIPDPADRRAYSYEITDEGNKELAIYKKERMDKVKNLLNGWSEEECEMFGQLLLKFNRSFT